MKNPMFHQLSPMESVDQLQHQQNLIEAYEKKIEEAYAEVYQDDESWITSYWPYIVIYSAGIATGIFAITLLQEILTWHS
jgi:hypothetical protein